MALLPDRKIAEWRATHREKKLFNLDCRNKPETCHQPARTVAAFCIDRTEVTVEQYGRCVQAGRCTDQHLDCGAAANWAKTDRADHPINCVDFAQAAAYCSALGRRLPSREEYGWAQSSGVYDPNGHLIPPWGGRYPEEDEVWASIGGEPLTGTGPVGSREAGRTRQGVAGLFGNVREWSAPYESVGGVERVAWLGYSFETTRETPIGAGATKQADPKGYDVATGFRCVVAPPGSAKKD